MIQDSKRKGEQKTEIPLESMLTGFFNDRTEQIGEPENVDPAHYANVNMNALIAAKAFTNVLSDPELAEILSSQPVTKKALQTIATLDAYLERETNPYLKEVLIVAAKKGDFDHLLDRIAFEKSTKLTKKTIDGFKESQIKEVYSNSKVLCSSEKQGHSLERLEGLVGEGLRLRCSKSLYEHRRINDNITLRIYQEDEKGPFKAIVHFDKLTGTNDFWDFNRLIYKVNSVFTVDYSIKSGDYNSMLSKKKKVTLDPVSTFDFAKKNYTGAQQKLSVTYNPKDTYPEKLLLDGGVRKEYDSESGGSVGVAMASLFALIFSLPIGAAVMALSLTNTVAAAQNKGLITSLRKPKLRREFDERVFKNPYNLKGLSDLLQYKEKSIEHSLYENDINKTKSEIDKTFGSLGAVKGYSVEFVSDSLDDIYEKAFTLTGAASKY